MQIDLLTIAFRCCVLFICGCQYRNHARGITTLDADAPTIVVSHAVVMSGYAVYMYITTKD